MRRRSDDGLGQAEETEAGNAGSPSANTEAKTSHKRLIEAHDEAEVVAAKLVHSSMVSYSITVE